MSRIAVLFVVLAFGAAFAAERGAADAGSDKEVRIIELNDKSATRIFVVRTAVGYPAVVEFPVDFASPPACCPARRSRQMASAPPSGACRPLSSYASWL